MREVIYKNHERDNINRANGKLMCIKGEGKKEKQVEEEV